ncbi:MAG TPA: hypothetical protein VK400_20760 [Pyrinomonadaceae bacterium]|nr:hypothetical protein [Pyrinomonadaceae bacterium]
MSKPVVPDVPSLYTGRDDMYRSHLLDQHRHFVEITMRYWGHIETANHFFLSLHTVIISGFTYLLTSTVNIPAAVLVMLVLVSCAVALQWLMVLRSLQKLNHTRHEIIQEWEAMLPAQPYEVERERLYNDKSPRFSRYVRIQKLYMLLPLLVFLSYLVFGFLIFFDIKIR